MSFDLYRPNGEYVKTYSGKRIDLPNNVTIHNPEGLTDLELNRYGLYRRIAAPEPNYNPDTHRLETQYRQFGAKSQPFYQLIELSAEDKAFRLTRLRRERAQKVRDEAKRRIEESVPYFRLVLAIAGDETPDWTGVRLIVQRAKEHLYSVQNLDPNRLRAFDPTDDSFWV